MSDREKERHRQREKQAPCREPDVGLHPGPPGPCPRPKAGSKPLSHPGVPLVCLFYFYFLKKFYSWERHTQREREAETQAVGEAGSMQEAWRGTRSQVSRIRPWAEGSAKLLSHRAAFCVCFKRKLFPVTFFPTLYLCVIFHQHLLIYNFM